MAGRRFLRDVRATVGDDALAVQIEGLFIKFRIKREATATPAEGEIDIYNLNESNETRIRERAVRVLLEAGYEDGGLEVIFDGAVRRIERMRADLDRITRIHAGGKTIRAETPASERRTIFRRTYEGTVPVRDIIRDGVQELGLVLGDMRLIPEDAIETDFRYSGSTQLMMRERLRPLGIEWYEEDGVIRFSRYRQTADDRVVTIAERTGMIGTPTVTDDGVTVTTLLDPRLRLDTQFRIESAVLDKAASGDALNERAGELEGGTWKVVEIEHAGDNRLGTFNTRVTGRPVG